MQMDNSGPAAVINVTPLIDVLLVLLIIFLVILPTYSVGLPVRAPQESAEGAPLVEERRTLVVTVMADGGVRINQQAFGAGEWADKLERVLAGRADRTVFFTAAPDMEFRLVGQAIDVARRVGATQVGLLGKAD